MKLLLPAVFLAVASVTQAQTHYLGVYTNGIKTGYSSYIEQKVELEGKPVLLTHSRWVNSISYGGAVQKSTVDTASWSTLDNRPIRDYTKLEEGGDVTTINVVYGEKTAEVDIQEKGKKRHKSVPIPDGSFCADPIKVISQKAPKPGDKFTVWVFESLAQEFTKVELQTVGPTEYVQGGKKSTAMLTLGKGDGTTLRYFTDAHGELVREELPLGMVMQAETKEEALANSATDSNVPDLVEIASLKMDKEVEDPLSLSSLKIRVKGTDMSKFPSDTNQTITQDGEGWIVDVHPARVAQSTPMTIVDAVKGYEKFTKPARFLTSEDPKIRELAAKLVSKSKNVAEAAIEIRKSVNEAMTPEIVLGAPRDATEIMRDKRGKCTDYAILCGTLMRAAGIPTRLCCGLITGSDTFYYHAWNEFWDGKRWVEIDSVFDTGAFSACHIKLAQGDAEEAAKIPFIDPKQVTIQLLESKH